MMILAYLRDGRVHATADAYEGGEGIADYSISTDLDGNNEIETVIEGRRYVSTWCWPDDSNKRFGGVPLMMVEDDPKG